MSVAPDAQVTEVASLSGASGLSWAVGDPAVWIDRLGLLVDRPAAVADPFRAALEGRHVEPTSWWHQVGTRLPPPWVWSTPATSAAVPAARNRMRAVVAGDQSRRANPAGLTDPRLVVAELVAPGFTNTEIATRLFISPKMGHQVAATLRRLGLSNRRAVVVQADDRGLV